MTRNVTHVFALSSFPLCNAVYRRSPHLPMTISFDLLFIPAVDECVPLCPMHPLIIVTLNR